MTPRERMLKNEAEELIEMLDCFPDGIVPITDSKGRMMTKAELTDYYRNVYWTEEEQNKLEHEKNENDRNNGRVSGSCVRSCRGCIHSGLCDEQDAREEDYDDEDRFRF